MATASSITGEDTLEPHERPGYRKLSLLNGVLIGAALALGSWGMEAWRLAGLPVENAYTSLILGSFALIVLCGFTGWLTGYFENIWPTVVVWLFASMLCALIIGYQPYIGRTAAEWLADTRSWGLPIYSSQTVTNSGLILGGLTIIITLTILALLQSYRMEQAVNELADNGRVSPRSWFILLLPMPIVALVALFTSSVQINPAAEAASVVYDGIEVAGATDEDLFQLGIQRGTNYAALNPVRDQLVGDYSLRVGEIDANSSQTFILAEFEDGTWINCRTINDQLSFCYDAEPAYTTGLTSLIAGEPMPEVCQGCPPVVDDQWLSWLQERASQLGPDPQIERLAQWGGYVLVQISATGGDYAIECLFDRMTPVSLDHCEEVMP